MMISEKYHFSTPLLSVFCKKEKGHTSEQWEPIPTETKKIDSSLTQIYRTMRLVS